MYQVKNSNSKVKNIVNLFVWTFILAAIAAIAAGDVEQGPVVEQGPILAQANENIEVPANDANEAAAEVSAGGLLQSFKFNKEQPIRDAIRVLAAKYHKNIVPSSKVEGILAFTTLNDVTFEEAMDAVLGANFKYEQTGNLIKVYTKEEYKKIMEDKERMIHKVFTLYYISAADAVKLISPVLSGAGSIQASSPAEKVVPTGESISSGSSGGDSMALNDTIVILDYPEKVAKAEILLKELDVRPTQVLVEATILTATLTEETALGVDWNTLNGVNIDTIANIGAGIADGLSTGGFASAVATTVSSGGLNVGITSDHVAVMIRALESITDVTVIANPKILALNKQLGQVYIGTKIGYVSSTTQNQNTTTQEVKYLETGTKLSFRPYIGNDGYIRMDINPKDSIGTLKANNIPDESSTELATNIMVKDGQTIVIGGLFRNVVEADRDQVPLLGDLPFIGAAFRGTSDYSKRQEVIVMLTTRIISEPQDTEPDARTADIACKRYGARMTLQGIGRARLAEDHYTKAVSFHADGNDVKALCELNNALNLRPTYLEALRLKEKITSEISPDEAGRVERIMLSVVEQEDAPKWRRN